MRRERILVRGGLNHLLDLYLKFKLEIMEYNARIKSSGYYVKPVHVTYRNSGGRRLKYVYFGRYWYRVSRRGRRVVWVYLGREKPEPSLPDPPPNPFEGVSVVASGGDVEVGSETLHLLARIEQSIGQPGIFTMLLLESAIASSSKK